MGLGKRIKEVREKLGISQAKFSKELGVSQIAVANLESEKNYPKFTTLIDVLKILGCDANYLLQDYRDFDKFDFIFSNEDKELIRQYHFINDEGKQIIKSIIHSYYYSYLQFEHENKISKIKCLTSILKKDGIIFSDNIHEISFMDNSEIDGDYVFQVATVHMKPMFSPGDYLLVKDKDAKNGDLGLFEIDGVIYSRRLIYYDNKRLLIPINQNHKSFDVTNSPYTCKGVIIRKLDNILEQ